MSSQQQSNTTAEQGNQSEDRIKRGLLDGTADEYVLAGELLGSKWKLPDAGNEEIKTINRIGRKQQGERVYYPEIALWPSGKTFRVKNASTLQTLEISSP